MSPELEALRRELTEDPENMGYSRLSDEQALAKLNAFERTRIRLLGSRTLLRWSAGGGRLAKLKRAAEDNQLPEAVQAIAIASHLLLQRADTELDMNNADQVALVNGLVASGILDSSDKDALVALATETVSRSVELNLSKIQLADINFVRTP